MKKTLLSLAAAAVALTSHIAVSAVEPYSLEAMGCMKLGECTDGVKQLVTGDDVFAHFGADWLYDYETIEATKQEIYAIFDRLDAIGIKVYLASGKNFPRNYRGSYYTDANNFYLNEDWVSSPNVFMNVLRHEGWHAAQDCMAGTIDNTLIAVIHMEDQVPDKYKLDADLRYGLFAPNAIPWEQEAIWAGNVPNMTADALNACASGSMWTEYSPTPKTREWLTENGYIN